MKCYDYVKNTILESEDKDKLLKQVNERYLDYNKNQHLKVACLFINNTYYLIKR